MSDEERDFEGSQFVYNFPINTGFLSLKLEVDESVI